MLFNNVAYIKVNDKYNIRLEQLFSLHGTRDMFLLRTLSHFTKVTLRL